MKQIIYLIIAILLFNSGCNSDDNINISESMVDVGGYQLLTISDGTGDKTVVFESGLGNNHSVWLAEQTFQNVAEFAQVITYNRAGYAPSEAGTEPRTIPNLVLDLETIIEQKSKTDRVILVGHSWGGPIIRAYAVKHPEKIAGLVFIDPTHEGFKDFSQADEDMIINASDAGPGVEEARQFLEGIQYISGLSNLPDVPVTVLTGMNNNNMATEERQSWYSAHAKLGEGVSDFSHISAENSGHYVMIDQPDLVLKAIRAVVNK